MREFIYSLAATAGFIGLATLYQNGQNLGSDARVKREADFTEMSADEMLNETMNEIDAEDDFNFMTQLGYFEENADIPEELLADVQFYQNEESGRSASKKTEIRFVNKCMKNAKCKDKAKVTANQWINEMHAYCEANAQDIMRPVCIVTSDDPDNEYGFCCNDSEAVSCSDAQTHSAAQGQTELTKSVDILKGMEAYVDMGSSAAQAVIDPANNAGSVTVASDNNVFGMLGSSGTKVFLIIPNGIPVTMSYQYKQNYQNYWQWFKAFNQKFMGLGIKGNIPTRTDSHFQFIRQDKQPKVVNKNPTKVQKNFRWPVFDSMMSRVQATAAQPNLAPTYEHIWREVTKRKFHNTPEGQYCLVLWFHQYLPGDLMELVEPEFQENVIGPLDTACRVIHIWVGFNDQKAKETVLYIQGQLQPSQVSKSPVDESLRGYFFIDTIGQLKAKKKQSEDLANKVYNIALADRLQCACMLATDATDFGATLIAYQEAANENNYDVGLWYGLGYDTTTEAGAETEAPVDEETPALTDMADLEKEMLVDWEVTTTVAATEAAVEEAAATTAAAEDEATTTAGETTTTVEPTTPSPPEMICCGSGFNGVVMDSAKSVCCPDSSLQYKYAPRDGYYCEQ